MDKISLEKTGLLNKLVLDYLKQKPALRQFYNQFNQLQDYENLINQRNFNHNNRQILVNTLQNQYANAKINLQNSLVQTNINLLLEPNTFTITTGHQLVLAGGPLFVAYKILTTIKLALVLKQKYPQHNFVPVLWLASEDHDFEEISEIFLFNKTYKWQVNSNNQLVGTLDLALLKQEIEKISATIGISQTGKEWVNILTNSYLNSADLSTASIKLFDALFSNFGLVVLEPNVKELKEIFKPTIKKDVLKEASFLAQKQTDKDLNKLGYKTQINAREINFFYLHEAVGRKLIKRQADKFILADTDILFSKEEIESLIESNPEKFSPNVSLRPVYQEQVLPNLAYIGGPAEVAYWLQLKSVFDLHHTPFPAVVLRFMALIVEDGFKEKVEKFKINIADLFGSEKEIIAKLLSSNNANSYLQPMDNIVTLLQDIIEDVKKIDNTIVREFIDKKLMLNDFFEEKGKDLNKALLVKQKSQIDKLLKLRQKLYPNNIYQERIETLLQYECQFNQKLSAKVLEEIDPFNKENLTVLRF